MEFIGHLTDREVADMAGCTPEAVIRFRTAHGIPSAHDRSARPHLPASATGTREQAELQPRQGRQRPSSHRATASKATPHHQGDRGPGPTTGDSEAEETPPEVEETPGVTAETAPEVEETPPEVEETPPEVEETPPEVEEMPGVAAETPPEVEETAPEVEETAPEVEETPPEVEEMPGVAAETPPEVEETPPEVEETAPGVEETPPRTQETAPEMEETAPHPGTEPALRTHLPGLHSTGSYPQKAPSSAPTASPAAMATGAAARYAYLVTVQFPDSVDELVVLAKDISAATAMALRSLRSHGTEFRIVSIVHRARAIT